MLSSVVDCSAALISTGLANNGRAPSSCPLQLHGGVGEVLVTGRPVVPTDAVVLVVVGPVTRRQLTVGTRPVPPASRVDLGAVSGAVRVVILVRRGEPLAAVSAETIRWN